METREQLSFGRATPRTVSDPLDKMSDDLADLKKTVEELKKEVTKLKDVDEIRKLQYSYGYYLDKCLYKEVIKLRPLERRMSDSVDFQTR